MKQVVEYRIYVGASYLGSLLTEDEAKEVCAQRNQQHPEYEKMYVRCCYQKYVRRPYTKYEEETGLPEYENPENKENKK